MSRCGDPWPGFGPSAVRGRAVRSCRGPGRPVGGAHVNMTDYEETRRTFRLAVPEDFNYSRDVVGAWSRTHPNKLALVAVDPGGERRRELTFADLARASNRVTNM